MRGDNYIGPELDLRRIDWLIVGGESGPRHRPINPDWVRDLLAHVECVSNDLPGSPTAFFLKQWGGQTPKAGGRELDGRTYKRAAGRRPRMIPSVYRLVRALIVATTILLLMLVTFASAHCGRRCQQRVRLDHQRHTVKPYRQLLDRIAHCESRGHYRTNTGNGFFGRYQFTLTSWYAVGGRGMPHLASRLEQDYRAVRLLHLQGLGAWPVCGR